MNQKDAELLRKQQAEIFAYGKELKKLFAQDAMIRPVLVYAHDDAEEILEKLRKEDLTVCVVVDNEKRFLGEITDGNIIALFLKQARYEPLAKLLNRGYRRNIIYKKAKDLMNAHKSTVHLDTPLNQVIELVYKKRFCYIPVVDEKKKVVGVVTPSSLINLLKDY